MNYQLRILGAALCGALLTISITEIAHMPVFEQDVRITKQEFTKETACLEEALWHEARGESDLGIKAVLSVIQNRKNSGSFPDSFCAVVHQKMQFSYRNAIPIGVNYKPIPKADKSSTAIFIRSLAVQAAEGNFDSLFPHDVLWYTTTKVNPAWTKSLTKVVTVDNHQFFRK